MREYHEYQNKPYLFHRKDSVILTYFDDCVILSHKQETTTSLIESLNNSPEKYVLKNEGYISNIIGVYIKKIHMEHSNFYNRTWLRK